MSQHSYSLADLQPLRQHLAQWGQLHEPRFEQDGVLRWIGATVEDVFQWTDGVPLTSLKPFFFTERETVFVFDGQLFRSQLPFHKSYSNLLFIDLMLISCFTELVSQLMLPSNARAKLSTSGHR